MSMREIGEMNGSIMVIAAQVVRLHRLLRPDEDMAETASSTHEAIEMELLPRLLESIGKKYSEAEVQEFRGGFMIGANTSTAVLKSLANMGGTDN